MFCKPSSGRAVLPQAFKTRARALVKLKLWKDAHADFQELSVLWGGFRLQGSDKGAEGLGFRPRSGITRSVILNPSGPGFRAYARRWWPGGLEDRL